MGFIHITGGLSKNVPAISLVFLSLKVTCTCICILNNVYQITLIYIFMYLHPLSFSYNNYTNIVIETEKTGV